MTGKRKYKITKAEIIEHWAKKYLKVKTWLAKLERKNESAWNLWLYCGIMGKTPDGLLAMKDDPRSREAEYLLDQFVAEEKVQLGEKLCPRIAANRRQKNIKTKRNRFHGLFTARLFT